jgi:hypothetical protein
LAEQLPVGDWVNISQADIDMFAKATNHHQWVLHNTVTKQFMTTKILSSRISVVRPYY